MLVTSGISLVTSNSAGNGGTSLVTSDDAGDGDTSLVTGEAPGFPSGNREGRLDKFVLTDEMVEEG
ncbi:hypothetical protein SAMN02745244_02418 [Tessaracoccus bendigoensis DSM 12906]|uniref:Uncharacterized protein n=2 Tax=Tessaracoccus TaxID=72763 RepID=A0A1M6IZC2_9ACTN|nr:hypothetical protein SAMN02745244_02418 [Tessaracoccus bendigoensis DSM 12906]